MPDNDLWCTVAKNSHPLHDVVADVHTVVALNAVAIAAVDTVVVLDAVAVVAVDNVVVLYAEVVFHFFDVAAVVIPFCCCPCCWCWFVIVDFLVIIVSVIVSYITFVFTVFVAADITVLLIPMLYFIVPFDPNIVGYCYCCHYL